MFVPHACCFAHLGRHLPSQSILHTHYSDSWENSKKLRKSFRYASKCLNFRKFGKNTGMFSILLSLKRRFTQFKPVFLNFIVRLSGPLLPSHVVATGI